MLRKTNGYFLLELLLSLSALFTISLFLLPLLMDIREQSRKVNLVSTAQQLMYEELQSKVSNPAAFSDYSFMKNGNQYQIRWQESQNSGQREVCVSVKQNQTEKETKVCGLLE